MYESEPLFELIASWQELPWLDDAACAILAESELDLFFTPAGSGLIRSTRALCEGCAARRSCVTHAFDHNISVGHFGGMSPNQRKTLGLVGALAEIDRIEQERLERDRLERARVAPHSPDPAGDTTPTTRRPRSR